MNALTKILAGGVGLAAMAAATPAAAQYYPSNPYGGYGYGAQGGLGAIIEQLLGGNRYAYGVDQRQLVNQCIAAVTQRIDRTYAYNRYGYPYGQGAYGAYGYGHNNSSARVLGITDIDRRSRDIRVRGVATANGNMAASPYGYGNVYGGGYAYAQPVGELSFECNVDYRGRVRDIDLNRNRNAYQYYRR